MNSLQFMQSVLDWLLADPSHIVTAAAALAALTPTPDPSTPTGKLYKIVELLALNFLHAKESGATTSNESQTTLAASSNRSITPIVAGLLLAGFLSACAMPENQPQTVYSLEASYNALAQIAAAYEQSSNANAATVTKIKQADQAAYDSLVAARKAVESNQSAILPATLAAAEDALTDLANLLNQNGVTS